MEKNELINVMAQFGGSDLFHAINRHDEFFITEGCYYIRGKWNLSWLFDVIACAQQKFRHQEFQVWEFNYQKESCLIKCTDRKGNLLFAQEVRNQTLPLPSILLWVVDQVCMLPSEF